MKINKNNISEHYILFTALLLDVSLPHSCVIKSVCTRKNGISLVHNTNKNKECLMFS